MLRPTLDAARTALRASFGYDAFRAGQEIAIESILEGRDTLVVLPTGGGKSVCYQVPALLLPDLTVVVSPLISLMKDQVDALEARNLPAAFINSTLSGAQTADRLARAARGEVKLLYLAPERFDFGNLPAKLADIGVSLLAIDEAHCISQWGHDFRPSYLRVAEARLKLGSPPTVALTATATPEVRDDICRQLQLRKPRTVITGFDRTNLTYHVLSAKNDAEKNSLLVETLRTHPGVAVVYASTRKTVDRLSIELERAGIEAAAYHAGLDDEHRREVQDDFMRERIRVIVATNAFGMGIDKPNVRVVIHHSMPGTLEAYYQEAGRAGRDGKESDAFLLHSFPDRFTHEFFIRGSYPERGAIERVYDVLRRVAQSGGTLPSSPESVATLAGRKITPREAESALRILGRSGAVVDADRTMACVSLRLLATPQRIKRELTGVANTELGLLRALWRLHGEQLHRGVTVDIDALPPGLAGRGTAVPLLASLQSRQMMVWETTGSGMYITDADATLARFDVPWDSIARRRQAEMAKLEAVQKYAYTRTCRREFVLRYFGDPAARSSCRGCDNCLGTRRAPARKSTRPRPVKRSHSSAPPADHIASAARTEGSGVAPENLRLFNALKSLRSDLAGAAKVPAYIVFTDRTLSELAARRPRSLEALRSVRGIGEMKTARYGKDLLALIRRTTETEDA